jgi:uncharacterized membrane-anchored protein
MCDAFQNRERKPVNLSVLLSFLSVLLTFSFTPGSFGQPAPTSARSPSINWIPGPATVTLGNSAEFAVPEGYRFVNADDARALLRAMNNPVPKSLAGILTPLSGTWMIIFEASEPGYVKDSGKESLDALAILKTIRERAEQQNQTVARQQGVMPISLVEWQLKPDYDRNQHSIEWAIRAQSGPLTIVNHVVRLFGRKAMVDGIAVQPVQLAGDIPLKDLMHGVTFKADQAYADYQKGDKLSALGITELITADDSLSEKPRVNHKPLILLVASGSAVVCFVGIIGIGVWAWRKTVRTQNAMMERFHLDTPAAEPRPAKAAVAAAARPNGAAKAVKEVLPRPPAVPQNRVNGKRNGHYGSRRRRVFDYQKYYSDLMLQVSDRAYEAGNALPKRNGFDSHSNGSNGSSEKPAGTAGPSTNVDLIASQMNLIEEQQRLIREQTKLIEEKTKLIQEKSQLLEKQIELFGNGVF